MVFILSTVLILVLALMICCNVIKSLKLRAMIRRVRSRASDSGEDRRSWIALFGHQLLSLGRSTSRVVPGTSSPSQPSPAPISSGHTSRGSDNRSATSFSPAPPSRTRRSVGSATDDTRARGHEVLFIISHNYTFVFSLSFFRSLTS